MKYDRETLIVFREVLASDPGQRFLEHLRALLGVDDPMTPEEEWNRAIRTVASGDALIQGRIPNPIPIDPVAQHRREGRKSAYHLILDVLREAKGQATQNFTKRMAKTLED